MLINSDILLLYNDRIFFLSYMICNGVLGLVSAYLIAYKADLKIKGIWLGMMLGCIINFNV